MKKNNHKCAKSFRQKHPNYSFTQVGYSVVPENIEKKYLELVAVETSMCVAGKNEVHKCKQCGKIVYDRIHR